MSREFDRGWDAALEQIQPWHRTDSLLPPRGMVVMTEDSGGNQQKLKRHDREGSGLWFFEDGSGYVYYTPKRWRNLDARDE